MGTTYNITYQGGNKINQTDIDKILADINQSVSTYIPNSLISQFNSSTTGITIEAKPVALTNLDLKDLSLDYHFYRNMAAALKLYESSLHFYDPTCMPLVNYWGFGYKPKKAITDIDSLKVNEMLAYVGLEKIKVQSRGDSVLYSKTHPSIELDFSASAKGYGVDLITQYLINQGVENALIEIGGETRGIGVNKQGKPWKIGINTPDPNANVSEFEYIVELSNQSVASSGNYRNFHEVNGRKYGHEINPITGYPSQNQLLSVSIISQECLVADAFATAAMVLGLEKAKTLIENNKDLEALFIIGDGNGGYELIKSSGFH